MPCVLALSRSPRRRRCGWPRHGSTAHLVGKTRRWLASELIHELTVIEKRSRSPTPSSPTWSPATGSTLQELAGIDPSGAARMFEHGSVGGEVCVADLAAEVNDRRTGGTNEVTAESVLHAR
jgi:hypothetical protein